jgi:hypothetical protein
MKWLRSIAAVAVIVIAGAASATASTIGIGAFSGSQTILTFEDLGSLPGTSGNVPAGYGSGSGVQFSANTQYSEYSTYNSILGTLDDDAAAAGLGAAAATWGAITGSGFHLAVPQTRVGLYTGSNVPISVVVSAYLNNTFLEFQTVTLAPFTIAFVGFENSGGIDRIVFGNNTACGGCTHALDNVMFETASDTAAVPEPTTLLLFGTGVIGTGLRRYRRRQQPATPCGRC